MLSFEKLKELIILVLTFGVIYWFQSVDDKKRCKKREGIYENVKMPLLVTCIVGLILFWESENQITNQVFIPNQPNQTGGGNIEPPKLPTLTELLPQNVISKVDADFRPSAPEFDVYTELPEW